RTHQMIRRGGRAATTLVPYAVFWEVTANAILWNLLARIVRVIPHGTLYSVGRLRIARWLLYIRAARHGRASSRDPGLGGAHRLRLGHAGPLCGAACHRLARICRERREHECG